uniref:Deleted in malignant brain tumors 1 protein n=1 Tax=Serinus canaria TaxID=9135 RepID=A0A8C9NK77_SERCA
QLALQPSQSCHAAGLTVGFGFHWGSTGLHWRGGDSQQDDPLSCSFDAIEVFDGGSLQSWLLGRVCRNDHRVFNSSGSQLTVLFRSDGSVTRRGFHAYYSSFLAFNVFEPNGEATSPFYPRNYPNNANCVWEIQVEKGKCVHFLMEGGRCLSDYVEIFDGPLHTSPVLGKICSGYYPTYTSSSNLLSVRFHSDSRHTYRGFQASYHSTPADDSTTLLCLPDYMHVVVSRYFLQSHGYSAWNLTLNDPVCTPNITSNSVSFNIPYTRCGTVREVGLNVSTNYSNTIRGSSSGTLITRNRNLLLHVNCKMLQNTWAKTMYVADDNFEVNETQYERYDVNLTFYDSSSFSRPVYESPYRVGINQNLFLEASLHSSDPSLELFLDTCVASPTRYNFTTKSYPIIKNGCAKDPTYATYYSPFRHTLRFKFNAFQFIQSNPEVYLQCELVVCRAYDYSSRCHQGCLQRSKREASSDLESVIVVAVAFPAFRHFYPWRADFPWVSPFGNWQHPFLPAGPAGLKARPGQGGEQMNTAESWKSWSQVAFCVHTTSSRSHLPQTPPVRCFFSQ